jgi:rod shape-determining protein MreC
MNKLKFILLIGAFVFVSLRYGTEARHVIGGVNQAILAKYAQTKMQIEERVAEHVNQKEEIARLRAENQNLQKSAVLSIAFAAKLNDILKEHKTKEYHPNIALVRTIGYANLNDYGKVWLDFEDFNASRIYGLLSQGYAAGIVIENDGHPQGLMVTDPKAIFAVYVGSQKMQGVTQGNRKEILVRYISQWMQPQIGDEVVTSGLDGIFFEGVKVGIVTQVIEEESSKTVVVKPHSEPYIPAYMHVIKSL